MNCSQVRSLLEEYFEGSLPAWQAEAVSNHVDSCAHCRAELVQIERLVTALEAVPVAAPSDQLLVRITTQVATLPLPGTQRSPWLQRWRWAAAAAGAGMATVGAAIVVVAASVWMGLGSYLPGATWVTSGITLLDHWVDTILLTLGVVAGWALDVLQLLEVASRAAAPTIGAYVAAEIGILLAIVLVVSLGRRREAVRPMVLV